MRQVLITEQGLHLHGDGDSLIISRERIEISRIRLGEIESLSLFGRIELTSGAIAVLVRRGIPVVFLTERGQFRTRLWTRTGPDVALRLGQLEIARDPDRAILLARAMIRAKVEHQRRILLRAQRGWKLETVANSLTRMRALIGQIESVTAPDALLGMEGEAAAHYFRHFPRLLQKPGMEFHGRSRRPPLDPPNACLSFGYAVLGNIIESEILRRGLDPFIGMFHAPKYNRPSLMLDLLEEWRPVVDGLTVRLINLGQLGPSDFENPQIMESEEVLQEGDLEDSSDSEAPPVKDNRPAVHLNATGRKVFLAEFYARLKDKWHYHPTGQSLEVRDIISQQVNHLARTIAQGTLDYQGFVPD